MTAYALRDSGDYRSGWSYNGQFKHSRCRIYYMYSTFRPTSSMSWSAMPVVGPYPHLYSAMSITTGVSSSTRARPIMLLRWLACVHNSNSQCLVKKSWFSLCTSYRSYISQRSEYSIPAACRLVTHCRIHLLVITMYYRWVKRRTSLAIRWDLNNVKG